MRKLSTVSMFYWQAFGSAKIGKNELGILINLFRKPLHNLQECSWFQTLKLSKYYSYRCSRTPSHFPNINMILQFDIIVKFDFTNKDYLASIQLSPIPVSVRRGTLSSNAFSISSDTIAACFSANSFGVSSTSSSCICNNNFKSN